MYPFACTYYNDDRLSSIQYPSGRTVTTCYDSNGRIAWVDQHRTPANCVGGSGNATSPYATAQSYWPQGAIQSLALGNGLTETAYTTTGCR